MDPVLQHFLLEDGGQATTLEWEVLGTPVPKGRPRASVKQGKDGKHFAQMYTPTETGSWEDKVAWWTKQAFQTHPLVLDQTVRFPLEGRVIAATRFYFDRPKSTPKKVKFPQTSRKDVDNLAKSVLDAVQGIVFKNDNSVTDLMATKRFAELDRPQGVVIELTVLS